MSVESIAVVTALLVHAGGFIWWASKINTLVSQLVTDVKELKDDRIRRLQERVAQ